MKPREERPRSLPAATRRALVLALLALFLGEAVTSMRKESVTVDEMVYIAAGYHHWVTGRFDVNATNPPLMKLLAGAPLLLLQPDPIALPADAGSWNEIRQWNWAREFFHHNRVPAERMLFWARLPTVVLAALLGLLVYCWSRSLYGDLAGIASLGLFALSPNVLAHARLATQDLGVSAFGFAACHGLWMFSKRPSLGRALWFGVALSAAALAKTSAVVLLPVVAAWIALRLWRGESQDQWTRLPWVRRIPSDRPRRRLLVSYLSLLMLAGGLALFLLNAGYGFEGSLKPLAPEVDLAERLHLESGPAHAAASALGLVPVPLPRPFLRLLQFQAGRVAQGNRLYFAGRLSREGWLVQMPFAFLVKTPLGMLGLLLLAGAVALRDRRIDDGEWLLLGAAAVTLSLFTLLKKVSVGLRYVLPMFPFLHVFAGRLFVPGRLRSRALAAAAALLLCFYAGESFFIHPHYLANFNLLVGGPAAGHRWLVDSYLDWGQDLKGLKGFMEENGLERIRLGYFGSDDAAAYGIDYLYLPSVGLDPRGQAPWWYEQQDPPPPLELSGPPIAVSATLLAGVFHPGYYAALRDLEPVASIGYSILVFDPDGRLRRPK